MTVRVLVIDNHDSFVHTLVDYLRRLHAEVGLVASDAVTDDALPALFASYDGVLLSPGPGRPENAGCSLAAIRTAAQLRMPLLGVCLGHQALGVAYGAKLAEAPEMMHGMTSVVTHDGTGPFRGIREPVTVGRYHSLALDSETIGAPLRVTARSESGTVMALSHESLPLWGVQFHPESILTPEGLRMLASWLDQVSAAHSLIAP